MRRSRTTLTLFCLLAITPFARASSQTPTAGTWIAIDAGFVGDYATDAIVFGTDLIVGGTFSQVDGQPASNIAAWNGTSWSALGSGLNDGVTSLTVCNGQLVAAGHFTEAGGSPANHVAAWNGSSWAAVGVGVDPAPSLMQCYNGDVFAAVNTIFQPTNEQYTYVMKWDGASWTSIISFFGSDSFYNVASILALDVADGKLFIGGALPDWKTYAFDGAGNSYVGDLQWTYGFQDFGGGVVAGAASPTLSTWDGATAWTEVNASWYECGGASEFQMHNGELVINGVGNDWGGPDCPPSNVNLISWNGSTWSAITEPAGRISALAEYDGRLFAVGSYGSPLDPPQNPMVVWLDETATGVPAADAAGYALHQNVPNPFNPTTVIRYDVAQAGAHVTLRIYDVAGQLVRTLVDDMATEGPNQAVWDGRDDAGRSVATGIYLYHLTAPGFSRTHKMVLIK